MQHKRPFDNNGGHELRFKLPRQNEDSNTLTVFPEMVPGNRDIWKDVSAGENEGCICKSHSVQLLDFNSVTQVSALADKELETSVPILWVTSSSNEADAGSETVAHPHLSRERNEFSFPSRRVIHYVDICSSFLDIFPRKHVPIGPSYQVDVPAWIPQEKKNNVGQFEISSSHDSSSSSPDLVGGSDVVGGKEKLMGIIIIPMPDLNIADENGEEVGQSRTDCSCPDKGSIRCVRQHVMEARERLKETLGQQKFNDLGFCDMGEEVARRWSPEERQVFHQVVFSNPASLGCNFWEQLSQVFPDRTKGEIVSYYFNVFMLRRRAVQNRSAYLDIDSDDDEWHESNESSSFHVGNPSEQEETGFDSLSDQDDDGGGANDDDDGGCDLRNKGENAEEDAEGCRGSDEKTVASGSCVSFDHQPTGSQYSPAAEAIQDRERGIKKINHTNCSRVASPRYLLEPCDAKIWVDGYPAGSAKVDDLLPTCHIIEEIFGLGSWDN